MERPYSRTTFIERVVKGCSLKGGLIASDQASAR